MYQDDYKRLLSSSVFMNITFGSGSSYSKKEAEEIDMRNPCVFVFFTSLNHAIAILEAFMTCIKQEKLLLKLLDRLIPWSRLLVARLVDF
jgi:hypothetical protein